MHFCIIFWSFFLIWKTFLFKFGLLGKLMKKEFPFLLLIPLNFLFFLVETGLRIVYCLIVKDKKNVITIYESWIYEIFFWIRHFLTLVIFAAAVKGAIYIAHPSYYKPQKWLI